MSGVALDLFMLKKRSLIYFIYDISSFMYGIYVLGCVIVVAHGSTVFNTRNRNIVHLIG